MWNFIKRMLTYWQLWFFSALAACTWGVIYFSVKWYNKGEKGYSRS